jgi:ankyrin repeat protein
MVGTIPEGSDPVELAHGLFDRCRAGETEQIVAHLDVGVPANTTDAKGNSLIMMAAYYGHDSTVQALVDRGADVNALNDRGQSSLAGAVFKGYADVVSVLLAAGADPYAGTPNARDTATFFEQADILGLIDQHLGDQRR